MNCCLQVAVTDYKNEQSDYIHCLRLLPKTDEIFWGKKKQVVDYLELLNVLMQFLPSSLQSV